jgi:carbon monoxide dehydrogenase subunit G
VSAPVGEVWAFLWDIERVARCLPGCAEVVTLEQDKSYSARVERKLGPFVLGMDLNISVLEKAPPHRIRVRVAGDDGRLRSRVDQILTLTLLAESTGQTEVQLHSSFELTGLLASLGQNLVAMQTESVLDDFVESLRAELTTAH